MPTGWRSVYLPCPSALPSSSHSTLQDARAPAGDLKGGAEDLRTHELGHVAGCFLFSKPANAGCDEAGEGADISQALAVVGGWAGGGK